MHNYAVPLFGRLLISKQTYYDDRDAERQREIGCLEGQLYRFSELLSEQRAATRENVQRKQARTGEEREDSDDEHFDASDSDDDDDEIPYNPKNLPLGWDGKVGNFIQS